VKDEVRDSDHQLMLALYSIEEKKKSYIEYDHRARGDLRSAGRKIGRLRGAGKSVIIFGPSRGWIA